MAINEHDNVLAWLVVHAIDRRCRHLYFVFIDIQNRNLFIKLNQFSFQYDVVLNVGKEVYL